MTAHPARLLPLALLVACADRPLDPDATADPVPVPFDGLSLEVEDFDGDARPDLLVLGLDGSGAFAGAVFRGLADGSFAAPLDPGLTGASVYPAVGELTGTGGVDVMIAQPGDAAAIYRWSLSGFTPYQVLHSPDIPRNHVAVDVDADGRNDVVVLRHGELNYGLTLHRGSDAPMWASTTTILGDMSQQAFAPAGLLVAHLDADHAPDALLYEPGAARGFLRVRGGPDGAFTDPAFQLPDLAPSTAALGDLDEDGALDILLAERAPARLALATGDGLGDFQLTASVAIAPPFVPLAVELADLDADGHLDVLAVDDATPELRFWSGTGDGAFQPPKSLPLPSGAVRVRAAHLDAGPGLDLAVATFAAGQVTILLDPLD